MKRDAKLMAALPALTVVLVLALFAYEAVYHSAPVMVAEVRR